MKTLRETLENRIANLEDTNGWDRSLGWAQLTSQDQDDPVAMYNFGRFAQLVDLLEDLS